MDQPKIPPRPPLDDGELDDAPGLTAGDEAALDAIRRQLAQEYPAVDTPPGAEVASGPGAPRPRVGWRWPLRLAGLVALAAVGGGVVGATITAHVLREAGATVARPVRPAPAVATRDPGIVTRPDTATREPFARPRTDTGVAAPAPAGPRPGRAARPEPPPRPSRSASPAPPAATSSSSTGERVTRRSDLAPSGSVVAASPAAQREAVVASPAAPRETVDGLAPRTAASATPAAIAKVGAPSGPLRERDGSATDVPGGSRGQGLRAAIREDWETVRSGFASAPDDFRKAWRALTRDLKGLVDRQGRGDAGSPATAAAGER